MNPQLSDSALVERSYVISCVLKPEFLQSEVRPSFFENNVYKNVYARLIDYKSKGTQWDLTLLYMTFPTNTPERDFLGATEDELVSEPLINTYAEKIKDNYRKRVALESMDEILLECGYHDPYKFQLRLQEKLQLIEPEKTVHDSKRIVNNISDYLEQQKNLDFKISGIETGFLKFNQMFHGFQPSKLYVLAARPSMGKSALMMNFAVNAARIGKSVYIHCLEESLNSFTCRVLSFLSGINNEQIQKGQFANSQWPLLVQHMDELARMKLHINDKANASAAEVCEAIRALNYRQKIDIVFIDHIQDLRKTKDSWHQDTSEACALFKGLAKDLKIPVIIISQLNRGVESRNDKHPMLSDLKESGDIEQKADAVIFIYRDDYYNPNSALPGITDITIAKNRDGRVGTFNLMWNPEVMRFRD